MNNKFYKREINLHWKTNKIFDIYLCDNYHKKYFFFFSHNLIIFIIFLFGNIAKQRDKIRQTKKDKKRHKARFKLRAAF